MLKSESDVCNASNDETCLANYHAPAPTGKKFVTSSVSFVMKFVKRLVAFSPSAATLVITLQFDSSLRFSGGNESLDAGFQPRLIRTSLSDGASSRLRAKPVT